MKVQIMTAERIFTQIQHDLSVFHNRILSYRLHVIPPFHGILWFGQLPIHLIIWFSEFLSSRISGKNTDF